MKMQYWLGILLVSLAVSAQAQVGRAPLLPNSSAFTPYRIAERGANHAVWERYQYVTNMPGRVMVRTNRYVELETGKHFLGNGQWVESREEIQIVENGAVATNGAHKVSFAANINSPVGIEVLTPDNKRLRARILGLSYMDTATGTNVLIAELKDSIGELLPSKNQVLYPDAFTNLQADVFYTYTKAGLEQDIVLREQPPSPEECGLDPATTRLDVLTEFFDPPVPSTKELQVPEQKTGSGATAADAVLVDESVSFGAMQFKRGRAFMVGDEPKNGMSIPVGKMWQVIEGRTFLIEGVKYRSIKTPVKALPARTASLPSDSNKDGSLLRVSPTRLLPPVKTASLSSKPMLLASSDSIGKGFVLDYDLSGSLTNYTFRGDTTYHITGNVLLSGTTTIEGGAVIKYSTNASAQLTLLSRDLRCMTAPYRPVIFTSKDDTSVGSPISGNTGNPVINSNATAITISAMGIEPVTLKNARISYMGTAFIGYMNSYYFNDIQVVNCGTGFKFDGSGYFRNVLLYNVNTGFCAIPDPCFIVAEHLTVHNAEKLCDIPEGVEPDEKELSVRVTNSLLITYGALGVDTTLVNCFATNYDAGIFQTALAGSHYLPSDSPYRNAGTTNINSDLRAALRNKTTYPPILYSNVVFSTDTTLSPQAQRDTDLPDLGYHYDPIDYLCSCCVSNATLTLTNAVAVGYFDNIGLWLHNDGHLVSGGTPLSKNCLAHFSLVQEQPLEVYYHNLAMPINLWHTDLERNPTVSLRFTTIASQPAPNFVLLTDGSAWEADAFSLQDCEVYAAGGSWWHSGDPTNTTIVLKNNLIDAPDLYIESGAHFTACNNLLRQLPFWAVFLSSGSPSFTVTDNAFDGGSIFLEGTVGYNAFLNGATLEWGSLQTNDIVTNLVWVAGPLGNYYQPTNSPLIDAGSTTADLAGLYHYTTQTNQVKEAASDLDIGLHYVAVDSGGVPFDYDGDGVPDYLEDVNGDGSPSGDPTSWQEYNSPNGLSPGSGLEVFTPLK